MSGFPYDESVALNSAWNAHYIAGHSTFHHNSERNGFMYHKTRLMRFQ
jgi:hypothetical protein